MPPLAGKESAPTTNQIPNPQSQIPNPRREFLRPLVASCFGLFSLGLLFCFAMVALISGYILYDTSNVMRHYGTDQHVAAALELLADVALLFWYIVNIMLSMQSRD